MTFKVKDGVVVGSTTALDANGKLATGLSTARTISLSGDVTGSATFDGTANATIVATIAADSVALGTDTTGNYVASLVAGTGISVGAAGEGATPTITNTAPNVTTDISITHNASTVVVNSSDGTDGTINAATTTLAGVMSSTDKTKLDGIASGATANTGTVTSVSGTGSYGGLSLSGTVTGSGSLTFGGTPTGTWPISVSGSAATLGSYSLAQVIPYHSGSDFVNGTLVTTSIPATAANGASFIIEVTGKGYNADVINLMAEGYLYNSTIINYDAIDIGGGFSTNLYMIENGGYLCFWWARMSYWQSFSVKVRDAGGSSANTVTNITDVALPAYTKGVIVTPKKVLNSSNYNSYSPTLTGTGASGTWGISISGNAATVSSITSSQVTTALGYTPVAATSVNRIYDSGGTGNYLLLSSANEIEFFNSSGVLQDMYLQYSGGINSLRGPAGNVVLHAGNYTSYSPTRTEFRNFGTIYINPNGSNANCTTAQFITHLTSLGFFNYSSATGKCAWDYAGNNDLTDTGFGTIDLAGCVIETWVNGDSTKHIRITRPTTGAGGFQTLIYNDQGSGYSPGWRQYITSENIASQSVNYATSSGNAATATTADKLTSFSSTTTSTAGTDNAESCVSYISSISLFGQTDGALYSHVYSAAWKHNIFGDYRTGQLAVRGKNNGTWQAWRTVLDSSNYNSYAVPLSGGTMTGSLIMAGTTSQLPGHFFTGTNDGFNVYFHVGTATSTEKVLNLRVFKSDNNYSTYTFDSSTLNAPNLQVNGNQVLHAGNYSSYFSGYVASGGSATLSLLTVSSTDPTIIIKDTDSGSGGSGKLVFQDSSGTTFGGIAYNATYGNLDVFNTNYNGKVTINGYEPLTVSNYSTTVAAINGYNATGTWPISITGSAASAPTSTVTFSGNGNNTYYVPFFSASSGNQTAQLSTNFTYVPNTGLTVSGYTVVTSNNVSSYALPTSGGSVSGITRFFGAHILTYAPTHTSLSANTTLTNAQLLTQIINTTAAATLTMPTGSTLESMVFWSYTNVCYDFYVINGAGASTLATATGITLIGNMSIAINTSAHFRIRRTAANTFTVYRLS